MSQVITILEAVEVAKQNPNAVFAETEGEDVWEASCLIEAFESGEIGENGSIPESREVVAYDSKIQVIEEEWNEVEGPVEIETEENFNLWVEGERNGSELVVINTAVYQGTRYMKRGEWGNLTMWWEIPGGWEADGGFKVMAPK